MSADNKRLSLFSLFGFVASIQAAHSFAAWLIYDGAFYLVNYYVLFFLTIIFPIAGLVLSIAGVIDTQRSGKKGYGIGLAGIIISSIEIIIIVFLIAAWAWINNTPQLPDYTVIEHEHYYNEKSQQELEEELEKMELRQKGYPEGYPEKPLEDFFHLTLEDDYSITRDEQEGFKALEWVIMLDGKVVLKRLAEDELVLEPRWQWRHGSTGKFSICLNAYVDGEYRRVSNIIEYTIES